MTHSPSHRDGLSRRRLLQAAGALGLAVPAAGFGPGFTAQTAMAASTAPLPPNAKGPAIPSSGYLLTELGDGLFAIGDGIYNMMFLVTKQGVVAVDAPPTIGGNILRAIRQVTPQPVTHVVYSHHHADHIGAASLYPEDAKRYSHRDTARLLAEIDDPNRPVPSRTFDKSRTLNVGGERLQLDYLGPNHSPGNLFIHAPDHDVLMLVDVIFPGWVPFAYLAVSTDIPGWVNAHDRALAYSFDTLVGGHLTRLGTRDDVITQKEYIGELRARSEYELNNVDFDEIYGSVDPENVWAVFDAYLDAVATQTADYLEPRWIRRLGGADVFTKANAFAMAEAVRIDYGNLGPFGIRP